MKNKYTTRGQAIDTAKSIQYPISQLDEADEKAAKGRLFLVAFYYSILKWQCLPNILSSA